MLPGSAGRYRRKYFSVTLSRGEEGCTRQFNDEPSLDLLREFGGEDVDFRDAGGLGEKVGGFGH
jgi:hypothetical protein